MTFRLLPLSELAIRLREKPSRICDLTEAAIANHEMYGDSLGAYKTWSPELMRQIAAAATDTLAAGNDCGPLHGIPVSVKDLYGVSGLPTFAGTPRELPERWRLEGPVVARVRQQLAPVSGKTHTVEFAFGGLGVNNHWGTPRNPWDAQHHRCPGGSSSGAGVSLTEGSALLALGTDTAGSVRVPASMTGNVGLKTSIGRWSVDGIVPLSPTLDTPGLLARSVSDVAYGFVAVDPDWGGDWDLFTAQFGNLAARDITIGVIADRLWDDCDDGVGEAVDQALKELQRHGVTVTSVQLPEAAAAIDLLNRGGVVAAECDEFLSAELPAWRDTLDPVVSARIRDGGAISAVDYLGRCRLLRELTRVAPSRFDNCDVLACPTVPVTPPNIDDVADVRGYRPRNLASLRNTCVANFLGLCAITLPVGLDQAGLPVGLQLLARRSDEAKLLAAGLVAERCLGTATERLGQAPLGAPRSSSGSAV